MRASASIWDSDPGVDTVTGNKRKRTPAQSPSVSTTDTRKRVKTEEPGESAGAWSFMVLP